MHDARRLELSFIAGLVLVVVGCRGQQATVESSPDHTASKPPGVTEPPAVTKPPVGYLGDAACAECHEDITRQYQGHSMGRSLAPVASAENIALPPKDAETVFTAGRFRYQVVQQDDKLIHRQSRMATDGGEMAVIQEEVKYAIGSGHHGQSYVVDRDGYLFMSPITWYPDKGIWDLSPGYEIANSQFDRPVIEKCLFCHSNRAPRVPHTANRYSQPVFDGYAIGCERCHGPGEQHAQLQRTGVTGQEGGDPMIVNPSRLEPGLREAVCQQCHLSGVARVLKPGRSLYDFRPGESADSCFSTFVLRPDLVQDERLVGQVEQMYESRCFQASEGQLGCISCHDPHRLPAAEERVRFYRDRCLQCHPANDCGLAEPTRREASPEDSCMACHMPRHETEVRHASVVNHRIPRHPDESPKAAGPHDFSGRGMPLERFPPASEDRLGMDRDLAIAMVMASSSHPEVLQAQHLQQVLTALERASRDNPDDGEAYEYLGQTYLVLGRVREALQAYDHVLQRQPRREVSLAVVADVLNSVGQHHQAIQYWQRAIQVNPWMPRYWYGLAQAYERSQLWPRCLDTAQEASRRFPTSIGARQLLVESHLQLGHHQDAEEAFAWLKRYHPRGMDALLKWYESHPLRQ